MQNKTLVQEILTHAQGIHDYVIQMRRDFHKHPETGFVGNPHVQRYCR